MCTSGYSVNILQISIFLRAGRLPRLMAAIGVPHRAWYWSVCVICLILPMVPVTAQSAVLSEVTFEGDNQYTPISTEITDGANDYWCRLQLTSNPDCFDSAGNPLGDVDGITDADYTNIQGSFVHGGEDLDGDGSNPSNFEIRDIDISNKNNLKVSALVATDAPTEWEGSNGIIIQYDIDNTGTFNDLWC